MYKIEIEGIVLNVEVDFTSEQKGGIETESSEAGFTVTAINHNGQDIYPIVHPETFYIICSELNKCFYGDGM